MDKKSSLAGKNLRKNEQNHQNQKSRKPPNVVDHCKLNKIMTVEHTQTVAIYDIYYVPAHKQTRTGITI